MFLDKLFLSGKSVRNCHYQRCLKQTALHISEIPKATSTLFGLSNSDNSHFLCVPHFLCSTTYLDGCLQFPSVDAVQLLSS